MERLEVDQKFVDYKTLFSAISDELGINKDEAIVNVHQNEGGFLFKVVKATE